MDNGAFSSPTAKPVALIRSPATNSGFVFSAADYNVDGRFNSIGQTSTSSSDISSGSENFRLKCRNDWTNYGRNPPVYKHSSEYHAKLPTIPVKRPLKNCVEPKRVSKKANDTFAVDEIDSLPTDCKQKLWPQQKSNNGNTVM